MFRMSARTQVIPEPCAHTHIGRTLHSLQGIEKSDIFSSVFGFKVGPLPNPLYTRDFYFLNPVPNWIPT